MLQIPERITKPMSKNTIHTMRMSVKHACDKNNINNIMLKPNTQPTTQTIKTHIKKSRNFGNGCIMNKGQKITLPNVNNITVCVGWETINSECDVDISAFMLNDSRKIISDDWFVFYGQETSPDNSLKLNMNGTQNDDKTISVILSNIDTRVSRIVFVLTIDEALIKHLNFSMIRNAYIRIMNNNDEIARFMLTDYYNTVTAMMLGELYRHNGQWKFSTIGDGVKRDLAGLCEMYGVKTE